MFDCEVAELFKQVQRGIWSYPLKVQSAGTACAATNDITFGQLPSWFQEWRVFLLFVCFKARIPFHFPPLHRGGICKPPIEFTNAGKRKT